VYNGIRLIRWLYTASLLYSPSAILYKVTSGYPGPVLLDPDDPLSKVLTLTEAAAEIGRPAATVRDWIRDGLIVPLRLPGNRRVWTTSRAVRDAEAEIWARAEARKRSRTQKSPRRTGG
jgi:hypothetical protein